jgi:hypothetical protein
MGVLVVQVVLVVSEGGVPTMEALEVQAASAVLKA